MRIAYFSPLNPQRSGISDYSEELLPYLARHVDIELFVGDYVPSNPEVIKEFRVFSFRDFDKRWLHPGYDVALYHMGNHPYHEDAYRTLLRYPGITVLHDFVLHHFVVETTVARGDYAGYLREMGYAYGAEGISAARQALGQGSDYPTLRYPLNERAIDSSLGVIVHSEFSKRLVQTRLVQTSRPATPVAVIPHGMDIVDPPTGSRGALGLDEGTFVIGTFGLAMPEKRLDVVLRAFSQLHDSFPNSLLLVVGEVPDWSDVGRLAEDLGLGDRVRITGFVDKETLSGYINTCDVCVNLRYPTCGETSGVVLRCMAAAKPVVVSHIGSFRELPDGACRKVCVDEEEVDSLHESLVRLATDEALRHTMGLAAQEYVRLEHDRAITARRYVDFIRSVLDGVA